MRVAGSPEVLALHGPDSTSAGEPLVCLGDIPPRQGAAVHWRATPGAATPGVRTVAPGGGGLWRRAPLPAADGLFDLADGSLAAGALVAGGDGPAREAAVGAIRAAGLDARAVDTVTAEALAACGVVVVVGEADQPLDRLAFPALAAGRLLVAPRAAPAFGLLAGIDHLAYGHPEELARLAVAATRFPEAFAMLRGMGRLAAGAQRASAVLARVVEGLDR
jgi:hypothetical protein